MIYESFKSPVLHSKHEGAHLLQHFDGSVAVNGGDDYRAIQRRTFTADTEKDGRVGSRLPKRIVHVVCLSVEGWMTQVRG